MTRQNRIASLLLLLFLLPLQNVHSFATYLLTNMGCMTDLSTDEVIMNSQVVAATESDRKDVRLKLLTEDAVASQEQMGDGSTRFHLKPSILQLELQLEAVGVSDVQFVVETSEGASFEHGQCDGAKRVAARGQDTVTLQLGSTDGVVAVWAGWATGHEAVRLTPILEFHSAKLQVETNNKQVKEQLEEHLESYKEDLEKVQKKDKKEDDRRRSHHSVSDHRRAHRHKHKHVVHDGGDDVTGQVSSRSSSGRKKPESTSRKSRPDHKHNHKATKRSLTEKLKDRLAHHKSDNPKEKGIDLDFTWFLYGLGILLVGNILVVQCCIRANGTAGDPAKGRRTL